MYLVKISDFTSAMLSAERKADFGIKKMRNPKLYNKRQLSINLITMKKTLFFILLLINFSLFGQEISFSSEILNSKDDEICSVRELWKSYVEDCIKSFITKNKSLTLKYWNEEELKNGYSDLIMYNLSSDVPVYIYGELVTFDIRKMENGFIRIKSLVLQSDSTSKNILGVFSIYSKKESAGYKLYNHFFVAKSMLKHYSTMHFDYFYPTDYDFNRERVKATENFYANLLNQYDFQSKNKITYIIGKTLDEANSFIGFDYSLMSSASKNAGYYLSNQNIIVSCREDHQHEIVHSVFKTKFPCAPSLFHEGIATYYGGTFGEKFDFHVDQLQTIIASSAEVDLSDFDELDKIVENKTNPFYTIGAIFIDYAFKLGGYKKVIALFNYPDTKEGAYSAITTELGIDRDKIDSFLKEYVKSYKRN